MDKYIQNPWDNDESNEKSTKKRTPSEIPSNLQSSIISTGTVHLPSTTGSSIFENSNDNLSPPPSADPWGTNNNDSKILNPNENVVSDTPTAKQDYEFDWELTSESIKVSISPIKKGVIYKYVNFAMDTKNGIILRRYNDFLWLSEVFLKKYPYRLIPILPPKKIGPDEAFLSQRCRGLQRFLNFIINHPTLKEDTVLKDIFLLMDDTDFQAYKKSNAVCTEEEFDFILDSEYSVPQNFELRVQSFQANLNILIDYHNDLANHIENIVRRNDESSIDYMRYSLILNKLLECECVSPGCLHCSRLNSGFNEISSGLQSISKNMQNELLLQRRYQSIDQINMKDIKKRISDAEARLGTPGISQREAEKWKNEIEREHRNVDWELKREMEVYHKKKSSIALVYQSFVTNQINYHRKALSVWESLSDTVFELPTRTPE
ncbi:Sorting nexin mvp1 [Lobulomyces angularis]|nr:Sorting nexin mvp1 [Lobulomyces angularis]